MHKKEAYPGDDDDWDQSLLREQTLESVLQRGLKENPASDVPCSKLAIDIGQVAKAFQTSELESWTESVRLALMTGNRMLLSQLLTDLFEKADSELWEQGRKALSNLQPFHIAATYFNGAHRCCWIFRELVDYFYLQEISIDEQDQNEQTVIDLLLRTVLRNHGHLPPTMRDLSSAAQGNAPGEEVSCCDLWDADSSLWQHHVATGRKGIPASWKHRFCHTSIQAICHSLRLWSIGSGSRLTTGLFQCRCFLCGQKLDVTVAHSFVFTTFLLVLYGAADEDLFGMICCLLQWAQHVLPGSKEQPFLAVAVSVELLLDLPTKETCCHGPLTPFQFSQTLSQYLASKGKLPAGWLAFTGVLEILESQYTWENMVDTDFQFKYRPWKKGISLLLSKGSSTYKHVFCDSVEAASFSLDCSHDHTYNGRGFGRDLLLGHIWAACQAELLTYRRRSDAEPWMSARLSVEDILLCLQTQDPSWIPYIRKNLLQPYCMCGLFTDKLFGPAPTIDQVCVEDLNNFEDTGGGMYLYEGSCGD